MIRVKKLKQVCKCHNCGYMVSLSPDTVKEKTFGRSLDDAITATYVECPVCGEKILKQLDNEETYRRARQGVKLELMQRQGKKLSDKDKKRLQSIEKMLYNKRLQLNKTFWDEIYQSLNQYEDEKTEIADRELTPGNEVTNTVKFGERMNEQCGMIGQSGS